ncbi:hypothetical protein B0A49_01983 [Cryomyces minteri]|uniref:Uncharacterized protein n=1 Tax=Cryomyces minteri TaxID=331657 RepID=A0A4U0XL45_9PEZI|nr:hypothetical protein B0A49_01983 [Cryomyces minteri]
MRVPVDRSCDPNAAAVRTELAKSCTPRARHRASQRVHPAAQVFGPFLDLPRLALATAASVARWAADEAPSAMYDINAQQRKAQRGREHRPFFDEQSLALQCTTTLGPVGCTAHDLGPLPFAQQLLWHESLGRLSVHRATLHCPCGREKRGKDERETERQRDREREREREREGVCYS